MRVLARLFIATVHRNYCSRRLPLEAQPPTNLASNESLQPCGVCFVGIAEVGLNRMLGQKNSFWGIYLSCFAVLLGCGSPVPGPSSGADEAIPGPVMATDSHAHFHLHAIDVEHDHEHHRFEAGHHTHQHKHDLSDNLKPGTANQ